MTCLQCLAFLVCCALSACVSIGVGLGIVLLLGLWK